MATNTAVNFTATASDPDGDVLAYYWDFGNGVVGPNSAKRHHPMELRGRLQCHLHRLRHEGQDDGKDEADHGWYADDLYGERHGAGQLRPADGGRARAQRPLGGGSYRGTFTDSSGQYTLTNLAAGSYTLGAVSAAFSSSATGSFTKPDYGRTEPVEFEFHRNLLGAFVTVARPTAPATEAGQVPASFTFTRGLEVPATSTQTINFTLSGTADKAADYTVAAGAPATGTYIFLDPRHWHAHIPGQRADRDFEDHAGR